MTTIFDTLDSSNVSLWSYDWSHLLSCFSLYQRFCGVWCLSSCLEQIISSPELAKVRPRGVWNKNLQYSTVQNRGHRDYSPLLEYVIKPSVGREVICLWEYCVGTRYRHFSVWRKLQHGEGKCWDYFSKRVCTLIFFAWRKKWVLICCPLAAHCNPVHEQYWVIKCNIASYSYNRLATVFPNTPSCRMSNRSAEVL